MAGTDISNVWDKLHRALHPADPSNFEGGWFLNIVGTANIIGAGSGGTSQIDNSSFVPGGSSLTPIGGYVGGRSVASGNTAAPAMNASGMLIVAVGAGGAGGGLAQLQVVGSDNSTFQNVGYPSGGSPSVSAVPVNVVAGFSSQATVNLAGQPISVVGSVNPVGVFAPAGSLNVVGSVRVTPGATFTVALDKIPTVNLGNGTVNIGNIPAIVGSVWLANPAAGGGGFASTSVYGSPAFPVYVIGSVNIVNASDISAGAGGGFASVAVYGSPLNPVYMQFPSGYYPTLNLGAGGGGGTGFASVAVYGSPTHPIYNIGTVHIDATVTVNLASALDQTNDAITVFQGNAASLKMDPRAGLTATQWPISHPGSGYLALVTASTSGGVRPKIALVHITAENSAVVSFQSPSGTFLTGSIRVPGAGGFNVGVPLPGYFWAGASNATLYMHAVGSGNIGGWLSGFVE